HFLKTGHLAELPFERRRHRGCHHVGGGARVRRRDLNGWIVDLGQRRHRKLTVGDDAGQQDSDHQQRCRDRSQDEDPGRVHRFLPAFGPFRPLVATGAGWPCSRLRVSSSSGHIGTTLLPACRRSTPCVTTMSCGWTPTTTSDRWSSTVPSLTLRISTDWSFFTR